MMNFHMAACPCFRLVRLDRRNARKLLGAGVGAAFIVYGGVCENCGRGFDLKIERRPGNQVRRG